MHNSHETHSKRQNWSTENMQVSHFWIGPTSFTTGDGNPKHYQPLKIATEIIIDGKDWIDTIRLSI